MKICRTCPRTRVEPRKLLGVHGDRRIQAVGVVKTIIKPTTGGSCEAELVVVDAVRAIPLLEAQTSLMLKLVLFQPQSNLRVELLAEKRRLGTKEKIIRRFPELFNPLGSSLVGPT